MMKRLVFALIICLPLASVAFGGVMLYFAINTTDTDVMDNPKPMSKTSWRDSDKAEPVTIQAEPSIK